MNVPNVRTSVHRAQTRGRLRFTTEFMELHRKHSPEFEVRQIDFQSRE